MRVFVTYRSTTDVHVKTCKEIKKLVVEVADDQTIGNFPDRNDDSDYKSNPDEEEEDKTTKIERKRRPKKNSVRTRTSTIGQTDQPTSGSVETISVINLEVVEINGKLANENGHNFFYNFPPHSNSQK